MPSVLSLPPCIEGDKGDVIIGVSSAFFAICVILTSLRIWMRVWRVTAGLGWDDASIIIAMVSFFLGIKI